jgi:hypothetical protein
MVEIASWRFADAHSLERRLRQCNRHGAGAAALQDQPEGDPAARRGLSELSEPRRPSKYTPETVEKLLAALRDELSQKQGCLACGISESTFYERRREHPELEGKLNEAREQARQTALKAIKTAGERDWKAHEAWLRLSFNPIIVSLIPRSR